MFRGTEGIAKCTCKKSDKATSRIETYTCPSHCASAGTDTVKDQMISDSHLPKTGIQRA